MHTILALLFHTLTWLNLIIHITQHRLDSILLVETLAAVMCHSSLHSFYIGPTRSLSFQLPKLHLLITPLALKKYLSSGLYIAAVDKFSNWLCVGGSDM